MASCTYNPGINSVNPTAVLNVTQQSQNYTTNKTVVRYELLLYRPSKIISSANKNYSIVIDGRTVKSGTTVLGGVGTKSIASGTVEIDHSADGSKQISFSFSLTFNINWNVGYIGTGNASGSMWLDTIPRATVPSLSNTNVNLGSTINITLQRASSAFTHNLTWSFGKLSGTIGTNLGVSASLVTSTSWATEIPNEGSGIGYIKCDTYNGSTFIGSQTVSFTASISTGMEPVIQSVNISEAVAGLANTFYGYVQNKSKLNISISAYARQGANIKSYKTTVCGIAYTGSNFTTNYISQSGTVNVKVEVTDSRGLTASSVYSVTVMEYYEPKLIEFSVKRTDYYGTEDANGTYATVHLNYSISRLGGRNSSRCTVEYRKNGDTYWSAFGTYYDYSFNGDKQGGNILDAAYAYEFRATLSDYFGTQDPVYSGVSTAHTVFNVNKEGTSICFGGVSERTNEKVNDFKTPAYFADGMYPYPNTNPNIGSSTEKFKNIYATSGHYNSIFVNNRDIALDVSNLIRDLPVSSGTWRPVAQQNMTITSYEGCNYFKIGRLVYIEGRINVTGGSQRASNMFSGLPYEPSKSGQHIGITYCNCMIDQGVVAGGMGLETYWSSAYDYGMKFFIWADNRSWDGDSCLGANQSGTINFSGIYLAN